MVETVQASAPQKLSGQLVPIGVVAAQNIAASLGLPELAKTIEGAIQDEIKAMSTHFTLAVSDVQTTYEIEVAKIKSEWSFVKANWGKISAVVVAVLVVGIVVGHFV